MRKVDLPEQLQIVPSPSQTEVVAHYHSILAQNSCRFERQGINSRGRMRLVVSSEQHWRKIGSRQHSVKPDKLILHEFLSSNFSFSHISIAAND